MNQTIRLVTLAPGHFHAALVQKHMEPGVHPRAYVYAPLDDDLLAHLACVHAFNTRPDAPTRWNLDVRAGAHFLERFAREPVGNVAVIAGRNKPKIEHIRTAVRAGLHVLADKPWVIDTADLPALEEVLAEAELRELLVWDLMTERFEVTSLVQRELVRDPEVFGQLAAGTRDEPALTLESVHYLKKSVAGRPLVRPEWWFDLAEAGPALADVGTHLADLAMWLLFPERPIDPRQEVQLLDAACWPTPLTAEQFAAVTGRPGRAVDYQGNGTVNYTLRGAHVRLTVRWGYEADPGGGDSHSAVARGTRARVAVRPAAGGRPEVFVAAVESSDRAGLLNAVRRRCAAWQETFPGTDAVECCNEVRVTIPDALREGHEEHFLSVFREFAAAFRGPRRMPVWERHNLLAKYHLTTHAVRLAAERG